MIDIEMVDRAEAVKVICGKQELLRIGNLVELEFWNGENESETIVRSFPYTEFSRNHINDTIIGSVFIDDPDYGVIAIEDTFTRKNGTIVLNRVCKIRHQGKYAGLRLWLHAQLLPEESVEFSDFKYFAPPALFDKNDLDEDGYEDYFKTQDLLYRDDRFNYPRFLAYHPEYKKSFTMERAILPIYDTEPIRNTGQYQFLQKTDIGSLGVWSSYEHGLALTACYPYYEGNATIGLYIQKTVPFGAFWPIEDDEEFGVAYQFSTTQKENFHEALWESIVEILRKSDIQAKELPCSPEKMMDYRLSSLNSYYIEKDFKEDSNCPAGYVLNCHPQDGKQLENIIQYGFTGQNLLNAYNVMRYGYSNKNTEYVRRARNIANFFVNQIRIPSSGMFYNLYNTDTKQVDFWWTGLLLPLAYAEGDELETLMGPLYSYRKAVIDKLREMKGAYLRCMNEDVYSLLRLYLLAKENSEYQQSWLDAVLGYGEFLKRVQEPSGMYYRAYTLEAKPIIHPEFWFGSTLYEKASSTGTSIPLLVEIYKTTGDKTYLECAIRAGEFVREEIIEKIKFNGGIHDSIYSKGQLVDNEGILYPMLGMLSLYEVTNAERFLLASQKAARIYASWACLWNVPLPPESTLAKYGLQSIGLGACDTCGAGYVHPFQLMGVAEMSKIALLTNDIYLLKIAELYWKGCNQTVSTPDNDWGYAMYGLQEEGYLLSWWAVDDPMFSGDTGFGNRLKGEGNKTCFPWITAVAGKAYWAMLDEFGTTDFERISLQFKKRSCNIP